VTCYSFYLWDADFGPPWSRCVPSSLSGHALAQRPRVGQTPSPKAGIGFTELSNGFAACQDPQALQLICDRLGPGTIGVFIQRWLPCRSPTPTVTPATGGRPPCARSRSPARSSSTRPARPWVLRGADRGQPRPRPPHNVEIIFGRRVRATPSAPSAPPSTAATTAACASTCSTATPASSNTSKTAVPWASNPSATPSRPGLHARLPNLDDLHAKARACNRRIQQAERVGQAASSRVQPLSGSRTPPLTRRGGGPQPCGSAILGSWP
jgi:hypothetical protein